MKNKYLEQYIYIFKRIRCLLEDAIQDESGPEDVFQALKWARNWKELEKKLDGSSRRRIPRVFEPVPFSSSSSWGMGREENERHVVVVSAGFSFIECSHRGW